MDQDTDYSSPQITKYSIATRDVTNMNSVPLLCIASAALGVAHCAPYMVIYCDDVTARDHRNVSLRKQLR